LQAVKNPDLPPKDAEKKQKEEQKKIDTALPLTDEENAEKESLLTVILYLCMMPIIALHIVARIYIMEPSWLSSVYQGEWATRARRFGKYCPWYWRQNTWRGKTNCLFVEMCMCLQVREYAEVFWRRVKDLSDYEKVLATIEKGEQRIQRRHSVKQALDDKIAKYKAPFHQLRIAYGTNKGKNYTEEEDRCVRYCCTFEYFITIL
jgi:SWI/SNF-related matrix-associated actin-dependent regulator of chromatin subfamily A member 5